MALIRCPECGKEISDKAKKCPHCNYNFRLGATSFLKSKLFKRIIVVLSIVVVVGAGIIIYDKCITPYLEYNKALSYIKNDEYNMAIDILSDLNGYKNADDLIKECKADIVYQKKYEEALKHYNNEEYEESYRSFKIAGEYKDTQEYLEKVGETIYKKAEDYFDNQKYKEANAEWLIISEYKDSKDRATDSLDMLHLKEANNRIETKQYDEALDELNALSDGKKQSDDVKALKEQIWIEQLKDYYYDGHDSDVEKTISEWDYIPDNEEVKKIISDVENFKRMFGDKRGNYSIKNDYYCDLMFLVDYDEKEDKWVPEIFLNDGVYLGSNQMVEYSREKIVYQKLNRIYTFTFEGNNIIGELDIDGEVTKTEYIKKEDAILWRR